MSHDKRFPVKGYLSAEEFCAFDAMCEEEGISHSSFIRMYIKHRLRERAVQRAETGLEKHCEERSHA